MKELTELEQMFETIVWRMVNGVLPENYGNLDVEIETGRQREYLEDVISQAIADHEQSKWTFGNKPVEKGDYIVQFESGDMDLDYYNGHYWDMVGQYAIAFRELPAPCKEGGEG